MNKNWPLSTPRAPLHSFLKPKHVAGVAVHVKRDRDHDTSRCAVSCRHEQVRKLWAMSNMCFIFRTTAHVVCEGGWYRFQRQLALNGVKKRRRGRCTGWK